MFFYRKRQQQQRVLPLVSGRRPPQTNHGDGDGDGDGNGFPGLDTVCIQSPLLRLCVTAVLVLGPKVSDCPLDGGG
ncbi:hypothetical protein SPI_02673 [Niveomyces insectorum RCEF 264]|uniref:Uncharacterized protein n=1 Tax=Niveomyces insectorum RCEF 264 TaxID=1081102 RepID=A0A167Y631_9HYPO|nr:hypothetical protein SPI_02673 [Niveomyces insectorum RCEF 264]